MTRSATSQHPPTDPPDLATLKPKPCLTCAREITPRAKWAKNWESIRTCSDGCKAQRPGVRRNWVRWTTTAAEQAGIEEESDARRWASPVLGVLRTRKDGVQEGGAEYTLDLDAWIERTLLHFASHEGSSSGGKKASGAKGQGKGRGKTATANMSTCEDVQEAIEEDAKELMARLPVSSLATQTQPQPQPQEGKDAEQEFQSDPSSSESADPQSEDDDNPAQSGPTGKGGAHPLQRALDSNPGLRERVRRAARRLAMLQPEHWALTAWTQAEADEERQGPKGEKESEWEGSRLELWNGGRRMESVQDVSYAKGPIAFCAVPLE
ncbi:hypothetical protein OC844_007863 [Tilletia horrida]|nr:hypothetical protein OC844_007863 [Tilletia horrida]